jgi:hypothetical protein
MFFTICIVNNVRDRRSNYIVYDFETFFKDIIKTLFSDRHFNFVSFVGGHPLMTGSQYTLMTLPTDPQSDQTKSRVPVFQCPGKI